MKRHNIKKDGYPQNYVGRLRSNYNFEVNLQVETPKIPKISFLVLKPSHLLFEIQSFSNIWKTKFEYLKTKNFAAEGKKNLAFLAAFGGQIFFCFVPPIPPRLMF